MTMATNDKEIARRESTAARQERGYLDSERAAAGCYSLDDDPDPEPTADDGGAGMEESPSPSTATST
jgi:hypothetical protein